MKKLVSFITAMLFLVACEQSTTPETVAPSENDQIKAHLVNSGFSVRSIEFKDDKVILGSDAFFLRADLLEDIAALKDSREKQYSTNYTVSASNVSNITVNITGLTSEWQTITRYAIAQWNGINGSALNFVETTKKKADIKMAMGYLGTSGTLASASFPNRRGKPGKTITVNTVDYGLTTSEKRFTMIHEMGHCIGFRHTNWFDRNSDGNQTTNDNEGVGSVGANHIPGTPTGLDPNSVMNAIVDSWSGFGNYDKVAVQVLYPN